MGTKVLSIAERGNLYEEMRGTIVGIYGKNYKVLGGGAFVVVGSSQLVLTAAHVVDEEDIEDLYIVTFEKELFHVEQVKSNKKRDIALLALKDQHDMSVDDGFECADLCETNELTVGSEVHFIGHPGQQTFIYNVGNISCAEKTYDIFYDLSEIDYYPELKMEERVDDFRGLSDSLKLVQVKNMHGGGRYGGTGAPILDCDGNIVGLYSFSFQDEDYAIHVADIRATIDNLIVKTKAMASKKT
ncbi:uncharacterized protein LOC141684559 [Apium graveolens]|uniref:uncharacterized protein LOC141684557 n=1 Tax=Apium graveolens TaxID=4045 RepID=UPI003D7A8D57